MKAAWSNRERMMISSRWAGFMQSFPAPSSSRNLQMTRRQRLSSTRKSARRLKPCEKDPEEREIYENHRLAHRPIHQTGAPHRPFRNTTRRYCRTLLERGQALRCCHMAWSENAPADLLAQLA